MAKSTDETENEEQTQDALARPKTWQEKLDAGEKLNVLDEVKADADYLHTKRVENAKADAEYEARKHKGLQEPSRG